MIYLLDKITLFPFFITDAKLCGGTFVLSKDRKGKTIITLGKTDSKSFRFYPNHTYVVARTDKHGNHVGFVQMKTSRLLLLDIGLVAFAAVLIYDFGVGLHLIIPFVVVLIIYGLDLTLERLVWRSNLG